MEMRETKKANILQGYSQNKINLFWVTLNVGKKTPYIDRAENRNRQLSASYHSLQISIYPPSFYYQGKILLSILNFFGYKLFSIKVTFTKQSVFQKKLNSWMLPGAACLKFLDIRTL